MTVGCSDGVVRDAADGVSGRHDADRRPAAVLPAGRRPHGPGDRRDGASTITNDEFSLFVQDQWQVRPNVTLQYGLRWDAQLHAGNRRSDDHGVRAVSEPSAVPVRRHDSRSVGDVAAAGRRDLGRSRQRAVGVRASAGIYFARQNMLSQVGSVTTNGLQQQTHFRQHRQHPASSAPPRRPGPAC